MTWVLVVSLGHGMSLRRLGGGLAYPDIPGIAKMYRTIHPLPSHHPAQPSCLLLGHIFISVSYVVSYVTFSFLLNFPYGSISDFSRPPTSSLLLYYSHIRFVAWAKPFKSMTISKLKCDILILYSTFMEVLSPSPSSPPYSTCHYLKHRCNRTS